MSFLQKTIYKLNNKKGISTIEIVIGMLIFLIVLCFLLDLLILIWKFSVIAQTNTQIARIAGIQGGVRSSPPRAWPGGRSNYITINDLDNIVTDKFGAAGISYTEWEVKISSPTGNGRIGRGGIRSTPRYDYKEDFSVEITVDYRWDFMSNILPGNLRQTITSKRPAMSEWKYNYDDWEGE